MIIAVLLFIVLLIWRLYKIGKIIFNIEFLISSIAGLLLILIMIKNSYYLYYILFLILIMYRTYEYYHRNDCQSIQRKIGGGWAIGCWISMVVSFILIYIYYNYLDRGIHTISQESLMLATIVGGLGLFYSNLFRVFWLVVLNVLFLFLSIASFASHMGIDSSDNTNDNSNISNGDNVQSDSNYEGDNIASNTHSIIGFNEGGSIGEINSFGTNEIVDGVFGNSLYNSTQVELQDSLGLYGGFQGYTNGLLDFDPFMYSESFTSSTPVIINNAYGEAQLSFFNGKITNLITNTQIGSYDYDSSIGMDSIFDCDGNRLLSMDKSGALYNSNMDIIGYQSNNSIFTTFTDKNGETLMYAHDSGTIFDNKGHLVSTIQKKS